MEDINISPFKFSEPVTSYVAWKQHFQAIHRGTPLSSHLDSLNNSFHFKKIIFYIVFTYSAHYSGRVAYF